MLFTEEFKRLQAHYVGVYALCDRVGVVFDVRIGTVGAVLEAWCEKSPETVSSTSLFNDDSSPITSSNTGVFNGDSSSIPSISGGFPLHLNILPIVPSIDWCLRTTIKGIKALFRANLTSICDVEVWFCNSINDKRLSDCACVIVADGSVRILLHPGVESMESGFIHECAHAYQLVRKNRTSELFATGCEWGYIVMRAFLRLFRKKGVTSERMFYDRI